jgi:hypothetical protein
MFSVISVVLFAIAVAAIIASFIYKIIRQLQYLFIDIYYFSFSKEFPYTSFLFPALNINSIMVTIDIFKWFLLLLPIKSIFLIPPSGSLS